MCDSREDLPRPARQSPTPQCSGHDWLAAPPQPAPPHTTWSYHSLTPSSQLITHPCHLRNVRPVPSQTKRTDEIASFWDTLAYCIRNIFISLKLKSREFAILPAYFKQLETNVFVENIVFIKTKKRTRSKRPLWYF